MDSRVRRGRVHPRRILVGSILGILLLVLGTAAAGFPLYVKPQVDELRRADAILILGGPGYDRYTLGLSLATDGWAPTVLLSNPNGDRDPWLTETCGQRFTYELICFRPDPNTTLGEGRELREMAQKYGWESVIVVTFKPHVSRARTILQRCFSGELIMFASPASLSALDWVSEFTYQTLGYVRVALHSGC